MNSVEICASKRAVLLCLLECILTATTSHYKPAAVKRNQQRQVIEVPIIGIEGSPCHLSTNLKRMMDYVRPLLLQEALGLGLISSGLTSEVKTQNRTLTGRHSTA